ncbi:MAG: hypothetical protein EPN84_03875 [Legionella sp.]|nr:MAG: hypothetical protein EPN84_03875 [Legionella sp.]
MKGNNSQTSHAGKHLRPKHAQSRTLQPKYTPDEKWLRKQNNIVPMEEQIFRRDANAKKEKALVDFLFALLVGHRQPQLLLLLLCPSVAGRSYRGFFDNDIRAVAGVKDQKSSTMAMP